MDAIEQILPTEGGDTDRLQAWCVSLKRLPEGQWLNPLADADADEFAAQLDEIPAAATSRSCTLAEVTVTASSSPSVSTTRLRLRPLNFLPASNLVLPPWAVLRVLCESMIAAVGSGALPTRSRHCWRRRSCMASNIPAAPPRDASIPPFRKALRHDMPAQARWLRELVIE